MAAYLRLGQGLTLALTCLSAACKGAAPAKRDAVAEARCDTAALAQAFTADTTKLSRREREAPPGGEAGGFTAIAYFDSAGMRRVVTAVYYGETGQRRYTFAFLTPVDYGVRMVEEHYTAPMSGTVASRAVVTRYVCRGREREGTPSKPDTVDVVGVLAEADSLLEQRR